MIGSAVNGGQWLPEAMSWVESNASTLGQLPVAVFCVHGMNSGTDEKQTRRHLAYLDSFRALVKPMDEAFFLGQGPTTDDTSLIARWAYKLFGGSAEGDMRDWDKIHAWAGQVQV